MMQEWEKEELQEQIGQAAVLIKKLLVTPDDCALRSVCEGWLDEHKGYLPTVTGYNIAELDGDPNNLLF